ncbi:MAG: hypothetical protein K6E83_13315 [Clostridium sp.]|nr:hypothetical protein [Clostridium sp.]
MRLRAVRIERGQIQMGACCDKTNGPAAAMLTVEDEETGKKYYCILSEYGGETECIAAKRDVLQSVCNLYEEDIIPWKLEKYTVSDAAGREEMEKSVFSGCFRFLEKNLRGGAGPEIKGKTVEELSGTE